jgi:hypothetical protein
LETIILTKENIENLRRFFKTDGYYKTKGMICLKMLNLPSLDGIIITKWSEKTRRELCDYLGKKNLKEVVVRTDAKYEMGKAPRGGCLVGISNIEEEIKKCLNEGRIVILLEPRNRFDNLYGINILFDSILFPRNIYLEVVGPGFDVSDITRGDITSHERIKLPRIEFLDSLEIKYFDVQREIIKQEEYRKTVHSRLLKIGRMVSKTLQLNVSNEEELIKIARHYLICTNNKLLLDHENEYSPIPFKYLKEIYDKIKFLPRKLLEINTNFTEPFVVSLSIFNKTNEIIFWDIQMMRLKYSIFKQTQGGVL